MHSDPFKHALDNFNPRGLNLPALPSIDLLNEINRPLENLGYNARWQKLPELIPGCEPFYGKSVCMVDDARDLALTIFPHLVVETGGRASFLFHTKDINAHELANAVLSRSPEIVLLDYSLAGNVRGTDVGQIILAASPSIKIIGFSTSHGAAQEFAKVGITAVRKDVTDVKTSLRSAAEVILA